MPDLNLIINGYQPPAPDENGIEIVKNKIWSKNTGRTTSGLMVGDIIDRKYTLKYTWSKLRQFEVKKLDEAINTSAFFPVQFTNNHGEVLTRYFYSDDPLYKQKKYEKNGIKYADISITLIEK